MDKKENPQAFPFFYESESEYISQHGMTLRDYFAAKAMAAYITGVRSTNTGVNIKEITESSYWAADEMLKERGKK